jgi:sensor histidine kinase YesM
VKAKAGLRRGALFLVPWLPFFLIWVFVARTYGAPSMKAAVGAASLSIGWAALLSIPVRSLCRALPWPSRVGSGFILRHVLAAAAFAVAWAVGLYFYDALARGREILAMIRASRVFGWQFVMGLWLYGLVTGITYAVDLRRHAAQQQTRAAEAEARAAAARLEAIRARLQPHFLFNALHSLGVLVRSDPTAAEAAVESLGQLLRMALRRDTRSLVPLDEEWSFSRRYLEFERIRYGDRLSVVAAVGDEALDCLVPPFALQTLVENAAQHAISVAHGGRIGIRARVAGGTLTVEVEDEGAPARADPAQETSQYGLTALRERMAGLYGLAAHLETRRTDGGGFLVRLVAPAVRSDEDCTAAAAAATGAS